MSGEPTDLSVFSLPLTPALDEVMTNWPDYTWILTEERDRWIPLTGDKKIQNTSNTPLGKGTWLIGKTPNTIEPCPPHRDQFT